MKRFSTKNMVITALLIAFGIIIPTAFGFLRITLPPAFTATLTAHIPIFIAMFISPLSALLTAIGTALGFFFCGTPPVVAARAASHIVFALVGAFMISRKCSILLCPRLDFRRRRHGLGNRLYNGYRNAYPPRS